MIKINLYQRKAAVGVASSSDEGASTSAGGLGSLLDKLKGNLSGGGLAGGFSGAPDAKALLILGVVYFVILAGGWWFIELDKEKKIADLNAEIATQNNKLSLLNSELSKTQGYEITKKNLEADEKKIRAKIETIQELLRERAVPPKILIGLSEAVPKEVWLREFSLKDRSFKITGMSNNMELVSDFIKGLSENIYFRDVQLKGSRSTETPPGSGREVTNFELEAQRR